MFILNAPRVFASLWAIVKPLIDPRTQRKIRILAGGATQLAALREELDDAVIPDRYGGALRPPYLCAQGSAEDDARMRAPARPPVSCSPGSVARIRATDARPPRYHWHRYGPIEAWLDALAAGATSPTRGHMVKAHARLAEAPDGDRLACF